MFELLQQVVALGFSLLFLTDSLVTETLVIGLAFEWFCSVRSARLLGIRVHEMGSVNGQFNR